MNSVQGDEGDKFFVIVTGSVDIFVDEIKVTSEEAGGSFGERSLTSEDVVRLRQLLHPASAHLPFHLLIS
eukprot:SAG31_NODE_4485_length_3196_cov_1.445270_5_plen_70_part_00